MAVYKSILRMIDAVRRNDVEMFLRYFAPYIPEDEKEVGEKCIRETFSEKPSIATMDKDAKIEELTDELDALQMRYLSQVSMWKSMYQELKAKEDKRTHRFYESITDEKTKGM